MISEKAKLVLRFSLTKPLAVLLVIAGLTLPGILVLRSAQFSPSIVESFVDNRQMYLDAMELESLFPANPDALLWLASGEGDQLFTQEVLESIRQAATQLEAVPEVRRVVALPNLPRPASMQRGLRSTTQRILLNAKLKQGVVPNIAAEVPIVLPFGESISAEELSALREELVASEELAGRFLTSDARWQIILIELESPYSIDPARQVALIAEIERIAEANGLGRDGRHLSGLVALQAYAYEQIGIVLYSYLPLGGLFIAIAVLVIFRRIEVVFVTLGIAAIAICWGTALGLLLYGKFSVLMAAVPLMVLVISTADVIHLISSYTAELAQGASHEVAVERTYLEVGGACVLTSVTTFVGFASLMMVPSNTIRQFGFSAAAGVASALLLSVLLIPVFLDWLHRRENPIVSTASAAYLTRWFAQACLNMSVRWSWQVVVAFGLMFLVCGSLVGRLSLDPDLTRRFTPVHPISQATRFFEEQLGGINSVEILLQGEPDLLLAPSTLQQIIRFSESCKSTYGASGTYSIAELLKQALVQIDYRDPHGVPQSTQHAEATVEYLALTNQEAVRELLTPDHSSLRILVRIRETSYMDMLAVSSSIADEARATFDAHIKVTEKGSAPLIGRAVGEIIRGHLQGFGVCFSAIFLLITFGLRSLKLGCLSVLPNLTPLLCLGGILGCGTTKVDSDILAVATLGLGLAVDDTIHFLSRFRLEIKASQSVLAALQSAMDHTGLAIIRTTVILSVGFLPFAFSGYWSINMLGTYLIMVLGAAVLADLLFLPAILWIAYNR